MKPMTPQEIAVVVLLQLAVILIACKAVGWLARRLGQPQVVGEMIAGVLIGPSVLGHFLPAAQAALFPAETKGVLFANATLGLALYMFLVGVEFDPTVLRGRKRAAASISVAGMLLPFLAGLLIAIPMLNAGGYFTDAISRGHAMLYLGACMSITAFPMLARIIHERGLAGTPMGALSLGAGAIDDACAWIVLAVVLGTVNSAAGGMGLTLWGSIGYAVAVATLGRWLMKRLAACAEREAETPGWVFSVVLITVLLGAWFTDLIRLYAVFGAFLLGCVVPPGRLAHDLEKKLGAACEHLLLPLFFTYSGLNTRLDLIGNAAMIGMTLLVILGAVIGKGGGCWLAARVSGEDNRTALGIGTLMNARGLMELIILSIGLQYAIITPAFYTVMVLMAIVTTLMTYPVFNRIFPEKPGAAR